jgi:histone-lysine N-methyltransferase SETMAR
MVSETIEIRIILRHYFKKGFSAAKAAREICDVEGEDSMPERTAQRWYQRFKAGDMSLEDKPRSGRPSIVDQEELRAAIEANPGSSTRDLSSELGSSRETIRRHLHALGFENKRPRVLPHELTPEQAQKRLNICRQLLQNLNDARFWRRIVTSDEKWIFLRNPDTGNQWLQPGQVGTPVVRRGRFEKKVMLCVWWNVEGVVHWELVPAGRAVNGKLYVEQLERVHEALRQRYPSMIRRNQILLQQDNAPAHTSRTTKEKIEELDGVDVLPHPPYSPDLAPSDYHMFRSMAHFLRGRRFNNTDELEDGIREFFASKDREWYRRGIEQLADRWLNVINADGLYFEE